jgi:hypothetical protein
MEVLLTDGIGELGIHISETMWKHRWVDIFYAMVTPSTPNALVSTVVQSYSVGVDYIGEFLHPLH